MHRDNFPDVVRRWVECQRISPSSVHVSFLAALRQSTFAGSWYICGTALELHDAAFEAKTLKSKTSIKVRQLVVAQPLQKAQPGSVASSYCGTAARQRQPNCLQPSKHDAIESPYSPTTPRRNLTIATAHTLLYIISPSTRETNRNHVLDG
jgi:hypothetical protein